jgi:porphobilinogen synthase
LNGGSNSLIEKRQAPAQGGEAGSCTQRVPLDRYHIPTLPKMT